MSKGWSVPQPRGGPGRIRAASCRFNTKLVKMRPQADGREQWYLLAKTPVIRGTDVRNARAGQDEMRKWDTQFTLSPDAGKRFGRFTESNIGNYLAVVMDNQIYSVAVIKGRIEDSGQIENISSEQEASDLALVLRAGALPGHHRNGL